MLARMAGTVHGVIDCYSSQASHCDYNLQELFVTLRNKFQASARHTMVAHYYGDVGGNIPAGSGRGLSYWDGASPTGRNAWFVVRFNNASTPYELLFQYQDGSSETIQGGTIDNISSNGTTARIGVIMATAKTSGGAWNTAWAGSTNNNGADTKATAWWAAPGGGRLYPFPRGNARGGGYNTNKNNMALVYSVGATASTTQRYNILFDDDNWCVMVDEGANGGWFMSAGGVYVPRSDLVVDQPLIMLTHTAGTADGPLPYISGSTVYGPAAAGSTTINGGIRVSDNLVGVGGAGVGVDVHGLVLDELTHFLLNANQQPNKAFATPSLDMLPLFVGAFEAAGAYGYAGTWDWIRTGANANNGDTSTDRTRAFFGTTTMANRKWVVPWDGASNPYTVANRAGVSFLWRRRQLAHRTYRRRCSPMCRVWACVRRYSQAL